MPLTNSNLTFRNPKNRVHGGHKNKVVVICENTGQEFDSPKQAGEYFGISRQVVVHSCRDRQYMLNYKGLAFDYKPIF